MLMRAGKFYDHLRAGLLGPTLSHSEVAGCEAILAACAGWRMSWTAYALATAYHETAHTMQPVRERGGEPYLRRMYDITGLRPALARWMGNVEPDDGIRYCGRGYVQLTWRAKYARAERACGVPLVAEPDLALDPMHAAVILRRGMEEGWFTGRRLADCLPDERGTLAQFRAARRIINGSDCAALIAGYAVGFQDALTAGKWRASYAGVALPQ